MRYIVKYTEAIQKLLPTAKFGLSGNDENSIQITNWEDETLTQPTHTAIKVKIAELETAYDNNAYQRKRANEYPSIADQLDDIYHNGIDAWKATIKTTKDKYPK